MKNSIARRFIFFAAPLTFVVIVAGAFTRLSDAGLGCPDWPTCYGQVVGVPDSATAALHSPDSPLDVRKAWIELAHRYVAGVLGILIFAAAMFSFRTAANRAPMFAAILVIAQALLGMLTVTELLRPIVVSAHLLGGVFIFAVLVYALTDSRTESASLFLRIGCVVAAVVFAIQIFLGGWVSTNYAALSCPSFPRCGAEWLPAVVDWGGFVLHRELHLDSAGAPISAAALATIHFVHRAFAIAVVVVLFVFGILLWRNEMRGLAFGLWILLAAQSILGIVNVVGGLPLWSALSHNAVAALLAALLAAAMAKIFRRSSWQDSYAKRL